MASPQTISYPERDVAPAAVVAYEAPRTPSRLSQLTQRASTIIFVLALVGFVARIAAMIVLRRWNMPNDIEHRQLASSLLEYGTFYFRDFNYYGPSSVQSPPYPILLAILFKLFGTASTASYVAAMVVNSIAGALTVWLSYRMVQALGGHVLTGLIAAALVAVWPTQVYAATHVQAVALITLCFVAIVYLFHRSVNSGKLAPWIGYSLVGTLAALTEPVLLPVVALSGLLILFWPRMSIEKRVRNAAVLLAAAILIIMPWTVRNRRVHGSWIPIKSTFWVNVWKGNNDYATGTDRLAMTPQIATKVQNRPPLSDNEIVDPAFDNQRQYNRLTQQQRRQLEKQPEAAREKVFKEFATTWIASHKLRYAQLCATRLWKTVWVDFDNPKAHTPLFWLPRALMLALMIPGIWIARRQRWALTFPALLAGLCLLTYTLTIAAARFSLPLEPLALAFVAASISYPLSRYSGRGLG